MSQFGAQLSIVFCRFYPIPGRGKRAHVTLGTSRDNKPVVTGLDVMEAVNAEKKAYEVSFLKLSKT